MFRSTTIIRELVLSLAKVTLEHSVKHVVKYYVVVWQHVLGWRVCCVLCRMCIVMLRGGVAACLGVACVLCAAQNVHCYVMWWCGSESWSGVCVVCCAEWD
jgi:hypothetical protein